MKLSDSHKIMKSEQSYSFNRRNWRRGWAQLQYVRCDWQLFIIQYGLLGDEAGVCVWSGVAGKHWDGDKVHL